MTRLLFVLLLVWAAPSQADLLDDIMSWFGGDNETTDATQDAGSISDILDKDTVANVAKTAASTGIALLPSVVESFGVTEEQAKGGLGAIFMAAEATLAPEDFKLISDAVPNIKGLMNAAPKANNLVGSAVNLLGGSEKTAAIGNLVTQFNELGLDTQMIAGFSKKAVEYVKQQSPDASKSLTSVLDEFI